MTENTTKFNQLSTEQQHEIAVAATSALPFADAVGVGNPNVTLDGEPTFQTPSTSTPKAPQPGGSFRFPPVPHLTPGGRWHNINYTREQSQKVEDGALFHARILSKEIRTSSKNSVYIYLQVELSNSWKMSHTRFLPKSCQGDSKAVAEAALRYLEKFGYNSQSKTFREQPVLAEIGSWTSDDGRKHYNVKQLFLDEADRDNYLAYVARKQAERAQREAAKPIVELPDV